MKTSKKKIYIFFEGQGATWEIKGQGHPLVAEGRGALLKMPSRSTNHGPSIWTVQFTCCNHGRLIKRNFYGLSGQIPGINVLWRSIQNFEKNSLLSSKYSKLIAICPFKLLIPIMKWKLIYLTNDLGDSLKTRVSFVWTWNKVAQFKTHLVNGKEESRYDNQILHLGPQTNIQ
jgi:hypothetical protein